MSYFSDQDCALDTFEALCTQTLEKDSVPLAAEIQNNIPIYDSTIITADRRRAYMSEWSQNLRSGSGVVVLKDACAYPDAIDMASRIFEVIIAEEKAAGAGAADHFAKAGANDRIWNSLQKLGEKSPETFARYFANPCIDWLCESWLGPSYQMTAQLNLVRPGGAAQSAHRDYHLGFQKAETAAEYPAHVHELSASLTLQGAIAHLDMPVESGTTKLLPFSQSYPPGYLAFHRQDFRDYFEECYVQLPLQKGDAVFFNPALFHAAGENRSEHIQRMVNLLQVSSAFGRAMESINRPALCQKLYPILLQSDCTPEQRHAIIAASAEGYAFPTNLDSDPPIGGNAPESMAGLVHRALEEGMSAQDFNTALARACAARAA